MNGELPWWTFVGLVIKEELENYCEKEIHHGQLYPNLDDVVDKGLVEKGELDVFETAFESSGHELYVVDR
ncbi:hypothetical protein FEJ81_21805 (plasmid) [Natrinema versiforme]|uniref:Transcription regulator PadR N-terminal domain-containing protein n=1 Tax=Natrinema versiforme TaxID=88724 RepID=A0A4P8WN57_9EURY|nr:hypothetical protein FEJ81_21805 [Natrinema versiforme]